MSDYKDQFASGDIKHKPQINEYEFNPHLLYDPAVRERHALELEHGIVGKRKCHKHPSLSRKAICLKEVSPLNPFCLIDYGVLTPVTERLSQRSLSPKLTSTLEQLAQETGLSTHEILLKWAWDTLGSILTTSTSKPERAKALTLLLSGAGPKIDRSVYDRLEAAAKEDGYEGKTYYLHAHMEK